MKYNQNRNEVRIEPKSNSKKTIPNKRENGEENEEKIKKPTPKTEPENGKREVEIPEKDHEHEFKEPFGKSNKPDLKINLKNKDTSPLTKDANKKLITGGQNKNQLPGSNPKTK